MEAKANNSRQTRAFAELTIAREFAAAIRPRARAKLLRELGLVVRSRVGGEIVAAGIGLVVAAKFRRDCHTDLFGTN
ncbi:MAG: hypothetical protein LUD39_03575, partial [Opitutae bacterium]|nr:hypothetical protein [Opitutae bacterium]